ncbi:hypothetical protein PENANT_c142G02387 [Penicillium antarcticum]|uniref:Uncharacterized protein n=1 Tax=Penicillium antarcticum TaxID=416450 RepID=A0A1V6PFN6_9EURO|nr:hypothetical protein PENANT_c142G02387 [Penicillium antarcticum]
MSHAGVPGLSISMAVYTPNEAVTAPSWTPVFRLFQRSVLWSWRLRR